MSWFLLGLKRPWKGMRREQIVHVRHSACLANRCRQLMVEVLGTGEARPSCLPVSGPRKN